jgi:PAS domain S-box-containing protein
LSNHKQQAQKKRSNNREWIHQFVEHAPAAVAILDQDMKYIMTNGRYLNDYHLKLQDLNGRSHYDVFPKISERWKEVYQRCLAGATEGADEDPFQYADGSMDWVRWKIKPWYKSSDEIGGIILFSELITEQKLAHDKIIKSEQRLRSLIDGLAPEIFVGLLDLDGKVLEANQSALMASGLKRSNVIGKPVEETFWFSYSEEAKQKLRAAIKHSSQGHSSRFDIEVRTAENQFISLDFFIQPLRDNTGQVVFLIPSAIVITERKQAEKALKEKTKFLDQIIETSALSLWISDEKGTAVRANSACLKFFGATEEEVIGKYNLFQDSVLEKKGLIPVVKDVFKKGTPASFVVDYDFGAVDHVYVRNATRKILKSVLTPVLDSNKMVSNVIVQTIDLTEIKQSEKEKIKVQKILSEHEKLSLIGQVAGKMAHDFNNVLGIIMGNAELALFDCNDAKTKKTLELIFDQTIRGKNLTKNLVAFAKDQEPKQEFFKINKKIDLVIDLLKKDMEGTELIKEDKPGVPDLLADPGMIEHTLVNLIQNSIHATSRVEYPKIIIRTYYSEDNIYFEIEDNGCGIPKEHLKDIFEPSFTLKGNKDVTGSYERTIKGTGYGMSNVKKYIDLHKGAISLESKIGSGTKITILLPVIKNELTSEEKTKIREEITSVEKYILLVEDETALSDIQYKILTQEPCRHKVDIANSGQIAMNLFDKNEYDFICLDYILPGKINGMDVYHHIRKTNRTVPILFVSGNIEFLESIKELKQNDSYIDHLSKPCKNFDYVNRINKLFGNVSI